MSASVNPGDVLADKYRVEHVLAMGGMGVVVAAHHLQLDEQVAIKFLRDETLSDPEAVARFAREARAAIKIKSEHVTRVIDVGALANGAPYMVMEYLEGETLATFLRLRGALPLGQAVEFLLQTCEAIAEAHALGIIHRDIKPANLFVTRRADGLMAIKVLDFGISKLATTSASWSSDLTRKSVALGSPSYMSPEQLACASAVDARTDIWSLGVTFFEMLTGQVPFHADTTPQLCGKILRDPPTPARELRPNTPDGVEAILRKCLEKERENRYANVGELAVALAAFGSQRARASAQRIWRTIHAPAQSSNGLPLGLDETGTGSGQHGDQTHVVWDHSARLFAPNRRRAVWAAAGLLVVGTVLAVTIGPFFRHRSALSADNARVREIPAGAASIDEMAITQHPVPVLEIPEPGPAFRQGPGIVAEPAGPGVREKVPSGSPAAAPSSAKRSRRATLDGAGPLALPPISVPRPVTSSSPLRKTPSGVYDERN
ncbi:MAG TPA: protein kinase [Polyangiaceae bacterium]|nr:protein kinase [Polyangiaceae bacterium]